MRKEKPLNVSVPYRLRGGHEHVGWIAHTRTHDSNGRLMYTISFLSIQHQAMFWATYFYADDLEAVG
jgi:hypothetical protein